MNLTKTRKSGAHRKCAPPLIFSVNLATECSFFAKFRFFESLSINMWNFTAGATPDSLFGLGLLLLILPYLSFFTKKSRVNFHWFAYQKIQIESRKEINNDQNYEKSMKNQEIPKKNVDFSKEILRNGSKICKLQGDFVNGARKAWKAQSASFLIFISFLAIFNVFKTIVEKLINVSADRSKFKGEEGMGKIK